jgi:hypothetical protein
MTFPEFFRPQSAFPVNSIYAPRIPRRVGLITYPPFDIVQGSGLRESQQESCPYNVYASFPCKPVRTRLKWALIMKFSLSFEAIGSNSLADRRLRMKPTFDQVLRMIVCVAGIVFFGVGIWMVKTGISANGVIDIKSEVLSGHLETGRSSFGFESAFIF